MPRSRTTRFIRRTLALAIVAGAGAAAFFVLRDRDHEPATEAASIFKTAELTEGTLSTSERIDGTLQLSTSISVLHRIEGQTSNATLPSSSGMLGNSIAFTAATAIGRAITSVPCVATAVTTTPVSDTTATIDPAPIESTTTTVAECSADDTEPEPSNAESTTTTVAGGEEATTTTTPGAAPDGARPSGGTGGTLGGAVGATVGGGTSTATGSAASTERETQVVTSVIGDGALVTLGDVLYTVDSQPVVALAGPLPAWRTLSVDSEDGLDIQQLEYSLVGLGYDPDGDVTVDQEFDDATAAMVERWQVGLGIEATGEVALGSVVFLPVETTVISVAASVGDEVSDGDTIVTLSAASQQVVIDVPDGAEAIITPGLEVGLGSATGVVTLLRSTERDGSVVVQAVITPSEPIENASNGTVVSVTVNVDDVGGVLLAPAEALLSHLDGTYAVEVQQQDGSVRWVTVDVLGVSGSTVGIRAGGTDSLAAGDLVLLPV